MDYQHNIPKEHVKQFVLAGKATVTLQSGFTGVHITYKIVQARDNANVYFVRLLKGPDNENDYTYIGCYFADTERFIAAEPWKSRANCAWPKSLRAIKLLFDKLDDIPNNLFVFHEGRCAKCGRKLTTPDSIKRGLGPECYKKS